MVTRERGPLEVLRVPPEPPTLSALVVVLRIRQGPQERLLGPVLDRLQVTVETRLMELVQSAEAPACPEIRGQTTKEMRVIQKHLLVYKEGGDG